MNPTEEKRLNVMTLMSALQLLAQGPGLYALVVWYLSYVVPNYWPIWAFFGAFVYFLWRLDHSEDVGEVLKRWRPR